MQQTGHLSGCNSLNVSSREISRWLEPNLAFKSIDNLSKPIVQLQGMWLKPSSSHHRGKWDAAISGEAGCPVKMLTTCFAALAVSSGWTRNLLQQ
jgi:hypothetical protein